MPVAVAFVQVTGIRWSRRWQEMDWPTGDGPPPGHRPDWDGPFPEVPILAYVMGLVGPAALFFVRRYPRSVIAVTAVATAIYYLLDLGGGPVFLSVLVAVAAWARMLRADRMRAARQAMVAEAGRKAEARRLEVAQELHDVLAHHISLISVQSSVALHLIDERPEQTREALSAIKGASKEALQALRGALDSLRDRDLAAPRAPTGGLGQLNIVADNVRGAGLAVTVVETGTPRRLSAPVDLAALRIVQESLTNVLRHAHADQVTVTIAYRDDGVEISVVDDGVGGVPVTGNGLAGIVERTENLKGSSRYGPAPGGGFGVWVSLPDSGPPDNVGR